MSAARDIEQTAAQWLVRQEEPQWCEDDEVELALWLDASWDNKAAFWRLEQGWRKADRLGALGLSSQDLLPPWRLAIQQVRRPLMGLAIAASVAGLAVMGAFQLGFIDGEEPVKSIEFATPTGGYKEVQLADGSTVELNTASVIRTAISSERRDVWLDKGEAFFQVTHKNGQPFVVHAGDRTVTVLGTKFSVRLDEGKVTVSVLEGRVQVESAKEGTVGGAALITDGGTAIAKADSILLIRGSEKRVEEALAWRGGMLSFDQTPLDQVVSEFNRYNKRKIEIADPDVAGIRIGGTFRSDNSAAFLRLLRDAYGFKVIEDRDVVKISE